MINRSGREWPHRCHHRDYRAYRHGQGISNESNEDHEDDEKHESNEGYKDDEKHESNEGYKDGEAHEKGPGDEGYESSGEGPVNTIWDVFLSWAEATWRHWWTVDSCMAMVFNDDIWQPAIYLWKRKIGLGVQLAAFHLPFLWIV